MNAAKQTNTYYYSVNSIYQFNESNQNKKNVAIVKNNNVMKF